MKTAKQFLKELDERTGTTWTEDDTEIEKAFIEFASQAIDECAEQAETRDIHEGRNNYLSHYVIDKQSILKVKDQLQ